jgi:hypothetical protein
MPTYFALYDPGLTLGQGIVKSSHPVNQMKIVYINQQDCEDRDRGRHRFITLGKSIYVVKAMLEAPHELLSQVIQRTLRGPLPETLLAEWEKIMQIRNDGSHVRRLSRQDYYTVIRIAIGRTNLEPLLRIKHALLDPEMGPAASSPGGVA